MTRLLDDHAIARAMRAAERALAARDPDTLAGRFSPRQPPEAESTSQAQPKRTASQR